MVVRPVWKQLALGIAAVGCATAVSSNRPAFHAPARGPATIAPAASAPAPGRNEFDLRIAARFEAVRADNQDLEYPELLRRLEVARPPAAPPAFDPTGADYYDKIRKGLELTSEEQEIYKRTGIVGVDHQQRYSMAGAYLAIFQRDLPVLVTSDSILHAMHRSFDGILIDLENGVLIPHLEKLLAETQSALRQEGAALASPALRRSAEDVDFYLSVARNLLDSDLNDVAVHSDFGQDAQVGRILAAIKAESMSARVSLYGRKGVSVDWSQFKPRGHYTKSVALSRYFRTMIWLGRVDLGFHLSESARDFGGFDVVREQRDAALLALLVRRAGQVEPLAAMDRLIGFLVGLSDNTTVADIVAAEDAAGIRSSADLEKAPLLEALAKGVAGKGQRIRSQVAFRQPGGGVEIPLPEVFQLFGQRFAIDSFVTSKLVFDSIMYKGDREERRLPTGLDVMAAFGNDEALGLAEPGVRQFHYAANLLAARRIIEERPPEIWNGTQYDIWLSALAKLDDVPEGTAFPQVMRSQTWARKQLQAQLGSWSELRHDTILYVKQSYTMGELCEYPTGYVEPYPEFFARVALFAEQARIRLAAAKMQRSSLIGDFLTEFATIVRRLETLARKELAAQPFDADEKLFIKETIRREIQGGCGAPVVEFSGWYPKLIYGGNPDSWEPTVADVHTDPSSGQVLEAAVGDANFLVAAIDNRGDRTAYVGPAYSYYEFSSPQRLTDEQWRSQIQDGKAPPRPDWVRAFQASPFERRLTPPGK